MRNGTLVGTEVLVPGDYRIGRADECDLHLDEATLSRVHARLVFNGVRVGIQDLDSDNGVLVNGEKVKAREVKSIDDVQLGKVTLKFKVIGRKPEADKGGEKPAPKELERTVPLAARPAAQELLREAQAQAAAQNRPELAPVPEARPVSDSTSVDSGRPSFAQESMETTTPGELMPGSVESLHHTQPSARRSQVAPDIKLEAKVETAAEAKSKRQASLPPRPVVGLVPQPAAAQPVPVPKPPTPKPAPPPPTARTEAETKAEPKPDLRPAPKPPLKKTEGTIPYGFSDPGEEPQDGFKIALNPRNPNEVAGPQPSLQARVWWGDQMIGCRTFKWGEPAVAQEKETAPFPLFGFGLEKPTVLAQVHSKGWAVHAPSGAMVEQQRSRGWEPLPASMNAKGEGVVPLTEGATVRIVRGPLSVEFHALAAQAKLPFTPPKIEPSLIIPLIGAFACVGAMIVLMPKHSDAPDFTPKGLPALRASLVPPKPKEKKEKEKEKVVEKKSEDTAKKPTPEKVTKAPPKQQQPKAAPVPTAVAALSKLTSGLAMSNLMAAKPSGGGRPSGLKMVGLKGIGPVAMGSGPGTGGGFGGGPITGGRELLGNTGNIGIGNALKGSPGGVVASAPSRQAQIHGSLSREEIAKVVNAHLQQVRACYERTLLKEPGLAGKLIIEWNIDGSGSVTSYKIKSSTMQSATVGECIEDALKSWKFPKPDGGEVVVSYPFIFNSVGF